MQKKYNNPLFQPVMHYFHVKSDIKYRYATTVASTRIENPAGEAQEVSFTAVLPETAFISGFKMLGPSTFPICHKYYVLSRVLQKKSLSVNI